MRVVVAVIAAVVLGLCGLVSAQQGKLAPPAPQASERLDEAWEQATREAVARVAPCVVQIVTNIGLEAIPVESKPSKPGTKPGGGALLRGQGPTTGLIVTPDGYIITSSFNFLHIPREVTPTILVRIPGRPDPLPGRIVARDETRMLTLLKVDADNLPVPQAVPIKEIRVGQWALALGRTFSEAANAPPSVSVGIISALGRIWGKAIQTDAKVSPVNYGGPLADIHGRVFGVLVPMSPRGDSELAGVEWYDSGIGFAVPLEDIYRVLPRLKQGEDLHAAQLGVTFEQPAPLIGQDPTKPASQGGIFGTCRIARVWPNSPAARAGLQAGDEIVEADGKPIRWQLQLRHVLGPKYDFETVSLKVKRGEKILDFPNISLTRPKEPQRPVFAGILPMRDDALPGVEIRYVFPKSPAEIAGLRVGDRIVRVDNTFIQNPWHLRQVLAPFQPGAEVQLTLVRPGEKEKKLALHTVALKLGEAGTDIPEKLPDATKKEGLAIRSVYAPTILKGQEPFFAKPPKAKPPAPPPGKPGFFREKDPTSGREYWLYVPETYTAEVAHGLVIWLHPAGNPMEEPIRKTWERYCKSHALIVYAPKAENPSGWLTSEGDAIVQDIRHLLTQYRIDPQRVVAHGLGNGGSFALYLALDARDWIRGAVVIGGPLASRIPDYDPAMPLAVFYVAGGRDPNIETLRTVPRDLQRRHYPTLYREIPEHGTGYPTDASLLDEIVRWIDTLDRL
uniref:Serine protease, trypsin family n=1 Tax=uncultured Planctomycetota bacterium TaxID=120965 RepID=H5S880_9BACT|nr:serine protease, trypsin family [uncultured Planctomycetota bacterium]